MSLAGSFLLLVEKLKIRVNKAVFLLSLKGQVSLAFQDNETYAVHAHQFFKLQSTHAYLHRNFIYNSYLMRFGRAIKLCNSPAIHAVFFSISI